jgi:hypothetical protein
MARLHAVPGQGAQSAERVTLEDSMSVPAVQSVGNAKRLAAAGVLGVNAARLNHCG